MNRELIEKAAGAFVHTVSGWLKKHIANMTLANMVVLFSCGLGTSFILERTISVISTNGAFEGLGAAASGAALAAIISHVA